MNNKSIVPILSVLLLSPSVFAEVTVQVPSDVSIYAANGKAPELTGGVFDSGKTLHLPDGTQQIFFRYAPYFSKGKDNIGVESDVLVATFQESNKNLNFVLPEFRGLKEAQNNIHSFKWKLTTENGQPVDAIQDKLVKKGIQFGRNYRTEAALYNQGKGIAAVHAFAPQMTLSDQQIQSASLSSQPTANSNIQQTATTAGPSVESMLHYWYSQADAETKIRFKTFVNGQ